MRKTTLPITAASFEKVFVRSPAATVSRLQRWRQIARKAIEKEQLGDALRRAIVSLPTQQREVLFLRDVKNLEDDETAWILGITTGAVRARLRGARMQVRDALTSSLVGAGQ